MTVKSKGYLRHVALSVADPWETAEFYKQTFGLTELRREPKDSGADGVWLSDGYIYFAILRYGGDDTPNLGEGPSTVKGIHHIGFYVDGFWPALLGSILVNALLVPGIVLITVAFAPPSTLALMPRPARKHARRSRGSGCRAARRGRARRRAGSRGAGGAPLRSRKRDSDVRRDRQLRLLKLGAFEGIWERCLPGLAVLRSPRLISEISEQADQPAVHDGSQSRSHEPTSPHPRPSALHLAAVAHHLEAGQLKLNSANPGDRVRRVHQHKTLAVKGKSAVHRKTDCALRSRVSENLLRARRLGAGRAES